MKMRAAVCALVLMAGPAEASFCSRSDIHDPVPALSFAFGEGEPLSRVEVMTEIERRLQIYHSYYVSPQGEFIYVAKITNGERLKGFGVCGCIVFEDSKTGFPIASLGGPRWGVNPKETRTVDPIRFSLPPEALRFIDRVNIHAGKCPANATEVGGKAAWALARAYLISQGIPDKLLPE